MTVGGAVISSTAALDAAIKHMQNVHGSIMSPQTAFYTLQARNYPSKLRRTTK
jgi:cystathionine beta-lyase/cystathionine gamma-synthase